MAEMNIYCDESNHLENDGISVMVMGAIYVPTEKVRMASRRIKEIKEKHGIRRSTEMKWIKVSPNKLNFYIDVIDYFFDNDDLHFRAIVCNKDGLDHEKFNQTHDQFYYKMYFEMLSKILDPENRYRIYLDIKDTRGGRKVRKLHEVLANSMYDFDGHIIENIQQVRSEEVEIMQLADILIGAMQFLNRDDVSSEAKHKIIERMRERSGYDLTRSTLVREPKTNVFYWRSRDSV